MTTTKERLSLKYRILFYIGGVVFATSSYFIGLIAFGIESAMWGDKVVYESLIKNLLPDFQNHLLSFFLWQTVCIALAGTIGYLFDREVFYRRKAEQKANLDGLTGIYNHRFFQERLTGEIERAGRYGRRISLIMLDLDNFKKFNDCYGHQEGDRMLRWFARICAKCIRGIDILARYGGEEFVVILPETDSAEAYAVADRIREAVRKQSPAAFGKDKRMTVSAGIATFPEHGKTRHTLILNADAALYHAKLEGKNRCVIYEIDCHRSYRATPEHLEPLFKDDILESLKALAVAADAKDEFTKGHSVAVAKFAEALGKRMGMSRDELERLRLAALLHDIGKILTPGEILRKKGPLATEEWKQIAEHPGLGSRMLRRVQNLSCILPGVTHHHERFDGKGYPSGLSGHNIPLLARVIAIADAYDAMINPRPYRPAKSDEEAIEELKRGSGAQFDPELLEMFVDVVTEERRKRQSSEAA